MPVPIESRPQIHQEIAISPRRGRSFGAYCEILGYRGREGELSGKMILDIGAGDSNFAEEAEKFGARIVRIDPKYNPKPNYLTNNEVKLYQYAPPENKKDAVAALAQELPFKDESFDEVAALYSSFWIKTAAPKSIHEMLRVTKENGSVTIWPALFLSEDRKHLPSFMRLGKVNPDFGHPTSVILQKDPSVKASDWDNVIETTLSKAIVANDEQFGHAKKESLIVKPERIIRIIGNY